MSTVNLTMTTKEQVTLALVGVNANNETVPPTAAGTPASWTVADPTVLELGVGNPDSAVCLVTALKAGQTTITATGFNNLTATFVVHVVSPDPTSLSIEVTQAGVTEQIPSGSITGSGLGRGFAVPKL